MFERLHREQHVRHVSHDSRFGIDWSSASTRHSGSGVVGTILAVIVILVVAYGVYLGLTSSLGLI